MYLLEDSGINKIRIYFSLIYKIQIGGPGLQGWLRKHQDSSSSYHVALQPSTWAFQFVIQMVAPVPVIKSAFIHQEGGKEERGESTISF